MEIFLNNIGFVRSVACRNAPVHHLVDDIVHDAFVHFTENAPNWIYDESKILGLLKSITMNMAGRQWNDYVRNLPSTLAKLADHIQKKVQANSVPVHSSSEETLHILEACLARLDPESRELIELYYFNGNEYSDLVEKTGKTPAAVYMQMSRIRGILHECIERMMDQEARNV